MCFSERPTDGLLVTDGVADTADRFKGESGSDESASMLLTENDETIFCLIFSNERLESDPDGEILGELLVA